MCKRPLIYGFALFVSLLVSCHSQTEKTGSEIAEAVTIEEKGLPELSLFNLDHIWQDQSGGDFRLGKLGGRPTVMAMIYTHCNYSCPRIVADMKELESLISSEEVNKINFLLVSIDPKQDKPDTLKVFMKENNMDPKRWTLLTSTEDDVRELAAVLGFRFKKTSLMDYAHSNLVTILNPAGEIIHQAEGFGGNKQALADTLLAHI